MVHLDQHWIADQPGLGKTLAANFNRLYAAQTGMTVGRTWVAELIKRQAYEQLHA